MRRICLFLTLMLLAVGVACNPVEPGNQQEEVNPPEPVVPPEPTADTLLVSLGLAIDVTEEPLVSVKSGGSDDLIGICIYTGKPEYQEGELFPLYACGVFDDPDSLKFKFVKGKHYYIVANYFPDAKNVVYNYPDGTFGAPFSYLWGLKEYKLNVPVYDDGSHSEGMPDGPTLVYLTQNYVQPTEDRLVQHFVIGKSLRYLGWTNLTVEDGTPISIRCEPWMMGITFNVGNFTKGELILRADDAVPLDYSFKPGDDMSLLMQIPAPLNDCGVERQGWSRSFKIRLYYSCDGANTLMATKNLECKKLVNYVFNFDLQEREDGTIGIVIVDGEYQNVNTVFD